MIEIAGLELLPAWPVFLSFVVAGLTLNLIPGVDMAFVMTAAARGGRKDGVVAALGIGTGTFVHIIAAVVGLSALLAASDRAFLIVKLVGSAYLLWIALSLLRRPSHASEENVPAARSRRRIFWSAALVNVTNPKVALFFLAFLPQFISLDAEFPAVQILLLGTWFNLVGTAVNIAVAIVAARAAAKLRDHNWIERAARWVGATILGALAVQLALSPRR